MARAKDPTAVQTAGGDVGVTENPWQMAVAQFDAAAERMGLDDEMRESLRCCHREFTVNFPVEMDDGSRQMFTGYRVHHNETLGPTKGGIRYHQDVTLDEVRALQDRMLKAQAGNDLKSSAVGRYQFIRKTFDRVRRALRLSGSTKFSATIQDRMAEFLLNERGFDRWRSGKLKRFDFQMSLSKEWASIPRPDTGKSYYGQGVGISQTELNRVLGSIGPAAKSAPIPQWIPALIIVALGAVYFFLIKPQLGG